MTTKRKKKPVIGWKKCYIHDSLGQTYQSCIVKLEILGEVVFHPTAGRNLLSLIHERNFKRRTNKVKVLAIYGLKRGQMAMSMWTDSLYHGYKLQYIKGEIIEREIRHHHLICGPGIHYFNTRRLAERYNWS